MRLRCIGTIGSNQTLTKVINQLTTEAILNRFKDYASKLHAGCLDQTLWFTEYACN